MNTFTRSWASFGPTKNEKRWQAFKDGLAFVSLVALHMGFVGAIWILIIFALSL